MDPSALMMVVSPGGKFHLINNNTKEVTCSSIIRDNDDNMYAASKEDSVSSYIDAIVDSRGSIQLGHCSRSNPQPKLIEWLSDPQVKNYVRYELGEEVVAESQEGRPVVDFNLRGKRIKKPNTETRFFQIKKKRYQILAGKWQLRFSKYEASFHDGNFVYQVHVYHTRTLEAFRQSLLAMIDLDDNDIINSDIWIEKVTMGESIQLQGIMDRNLYLGLFQGLLKAAVKLYPKDHVFSSNSRKLWGTNNCTNIQRFYGAKVDHSSYYLAFEYCEDTLYNYSVTTLWDSKEPPKDYLEIWRGLFSGLVYLDSQGLCHEHLNPWDVLFAIRYVTKISGLCKAQTFTKELARKVLLDLAKLIIFCHSLQPGICKETYAKSQMDRTEMFSWAYEARDLVDRLHDGRISSLTEVAMHPLFWYDERCIEYAKHASLLLEDFLDKVTSDEALKVIQSDIFPSGDWKKDIQNGLQLEMEGNNYDPNKPRDLLRFVRNICSHVPMISIGQNLTEEDQAFLGSDKLAVWSAFRSLFPNLIIKFYTFLEGYVPRKYMAGLERYYPSI